MTDGREHSRSGPAAKFGASSGANQLRGTGGVPADPPEVDDVEKDAVVEGEVIDGGEANADEQAFARSGQFTGRPIPQQDVPADPALAARMEDARLGNADAVIDSEIGGLQEELAQTTSHLQRLAADFDNYRKRSAREVQAARAGADAKLLGELLVVLDDFERAIEVGSADGATIAGLLEGVQMIDGRLRNVLAGAGLTDIPTDGQFDPHLHEALLVQPGSGQPEGSIITVVQRGYALGEKVVRHAKVIVAGGD